MLFIFLTKIKKYDESKWDLEMIRADFTYDINCEGQEIKIGVIDSGIADHADLKGNILDSEISALCQNSSPV